MKIDIEVKEVVELITIELTPGEAQALSLALNQHLCRLDQRPQSWPWLREFRDRLDNARVGKTNDPLPAREPDRI